MDSEYAEFSAMMKQRRYAEAAALADRQVVAAGGRSEFWLTRLSAALRESGDVDGALDAADKACAIAPANAWALLARAEALFKKGEPSQALPYFDDARSDARTAARARRGALNCLARMKQWDRLIESLMAWAVPDAEAYPWKTRALAGLGKNVEALAVCAQWLAAFPDNRDALWQQAELWTAADGIDAALARMARLSKIPGKPAVYGEIYAALCKRAGRADDAARQYGRLLDREASPALLRKQAFALAKSGREAEAIPMLEELLRGAPSDMYLNNGYIGACGRGGALERAWNFYHELMALHPSEKSLYGRLARVRKLIEKVPKAPGEGGAA